ncbi:heavy-metal-associated domain-containing protein [Falsihalocynthiibacter sp. S25ZX9]|uniref:heavy-metal-associated domain-containing protein n=1 Tax=Falsihalocynthiibacter sp. S25ZX9 TaxID=3240870 RepID=UPI00350F5956
MRKFKVPDMSCGHCTATIEKAVVAADSTAALTFDLKEHVVSVDSCLDNEAFKEILKTAGYSSHSAT